MHDDSLHQSKIAFVFLCLINVVAYASVIRSNIFYNDDILRVLYNFEGWESSGRALATLFSRILFGGTNADATPLVQILAIISLSLTGCMLFKSFDATPNNLYLLLFAPVAIQPYMLENLSYKFDALWMSLSIFFQVLPFYIKTKQKNRFYIFIMSAAAFLSSMNLYQASLGVFFVISSFSFFKHITQDSKIVVFFKKNVDIFGGLLLSILLYTLEMRFITPISGDYATRHSSIPGKNILEIFLANCHKYFTFLSTDWKDVVVGYIFVFDCATILILIILKILREFSRKRKLLKIACLIVTFTFMLFASYFPQFFLADPVFRPRTFLSIGVLVSIILYETTRLSAVNRYFHKAVIGINTYFILQLLVISNIYGNILSSQNAYENIYIPMIVQDIAKTRQETGCKKFDIKGTLGYTPEIKNIGKHFPVLYKLVLPHITDWFFIPYQFEYYGLNIKERGIVADSNKIKIFYDESKFTIGYAQNGICTIYFK